MRATTTSRPPTGRRSLSVIICTRERPHLLPHSLRALREQTDLDFELVIVENAPRDDRTREAVSSEWPEAVYAVEPVPGLPRARNLGIEAASGEILVFTDDDCRPVPEWIQAIRAAFAAEPEAGCVTGPIRPRELRSEPQRRMETRGGFGRGSQRVVYRPGEERGPVYPVQAWMFGAGGNMALTRECLSGIGGFDPALWRSEDIDIFYWTLRAGCAIVFEPAAAVQHDHLPEWRQLRRRMFHWGWGYLALLDKIARRDGPEYRRRARAERRSWLRYQLGQRLLPGLHGRADLPLSLVATEIVGGLVGYFGYPIAEWASRREALRARAAHVRQAGAEIPIHG
jgi:GT2 family glycosyltransferase